MKWIPASAGMTERGQERQKVEDFIMRLKNLTAENAENAKKENINRGERRVRRVKGNMCKLRSTNEI